MVIRKKAKSKQNRRKMMEIGVRQIGRRYLMGVSVVYPALGSQLLHPDPSCQERAVSEDDD